MTVHGMKHRNRLKERGEIMSRFAVMFKAVYRFVRPTALLIACSSCVEAQQPQAKELLARAVHLADLFNWADAAPAFTEAEQLFAGAGDRRNALYARLGRIRSNIERDQQTLPMVSLTVPCFWMCVEDVRRNACCVRSRMPTLCASGFSCFFR